MRTINHKFSFTDKTAWFWPEIDQDLIKVIDQVNDIDYIMQFVDHRRVCIQAGGACGIWPFRFSQLFSTVYTFEPVATNFDCLQSNLRECVNVFRYRAALYKAARRGIVDRHVTELFNTGAGYFAEGPGTVKSLALDPLDINNVDLIQLDIEGGEYEALMGATAIINRDSPVIVIEEKSLPQVKDSRVLLAREFLEKLGYRQVGAIHRDIVFKR